MAINRDYFVIRKFDDGAIAATHVYTDDIDGYVERERTAILLPTTVTLVEPCENFMTCTHRRDHAADLGSPYPAQTDLSGL